MQKDTVNNIHVSSEEALVTPDELIYEIHVSIKTLQCIITYRKLISDINNDDEHILSDVSGHNSIQDKKHTKA